VGFWNDERKKHGEGHLLLSDGTRYDGNFENDLFDGLGVLSFADGARYTIQVYCSCIDVKRSK